MSFLRSLWADTRGAILPYVTVMLVVILGLSALAVDGSRYVGLHTHLQNGADALALAGAYELDRLPGARARATDAINTLIDNQLNVGSGNQSIVQAQVNFYSQLPATDDLPMSSAVVAADDTEAQYVEVIVQPVSTGAIFPISYLFGGSNTLTTQASAVAGNNRVSCGITPMFICNPFEQSGDTYEQATQRLLDADTDPTFKRKLIKLEENNPSGTWGPGDFGYLVPGTGALAEDKCFSSGGGGIGQAMAAASPEICFVENGVDLQPGNTQAAQNGVNTRFALYNPPGDNVTCATSYPPDVNVRKGYKEGGGVGKPDWCKAVPDEPGLGSAWPPGEFSRSYPLDEPPWSGNIGSGNWNCLGYWNDVHGDDGTAAPSGCGNAADTTISRKDLHDYEIAQGTLNHVALPPSAETGAPQCFPALATADRRVLFVAIVNCASSPVPIMSNATGVPVAAVGKFFLTHPWAHNSVPPYAEFMGLATQGDGVNFDQSQLYR